VTAAFNLDAETRKAMARPLGSARLAGVSRPALPTPEEMARYGDGYRRYSLRDEPLPEAIVAEGEYQDAVAEQVGCHEYEPDDRWDTPHPGGARWSDETF
jgi:hypothetical protein